MHTNILDGFGRPDSIEWRHLGHAIRRNSHPTSRADAYLVWDGSDRCIEQAPSLQAARRLIEQGI
jgi:hypothetical protein